MRIGNRPRPEMGAAATVGEWYMGIEILSCPPERRSIFKPYLFVWFFKITDAGEPYKLEGRPREKIGGWLVWESSIGIAIEVIRDHRRFYVR